MSKISELPASSQILWTDEELMSALQAYLLMLRSELQGDRYNKAEVNRRLREGPLAARTEKSVGYRMQNISALLDELGMPYVSGFSPARNIGSAVKKKLTELMRRSDIEFLTEYARTADANALSSQVSKLRRQAFLRIPLGSKYPKLEVKKTSHYVRDPAVKAWILKVAYGRCEGCDHAAPFIGNDGLPYLEVHHVMPLASHGSDTPTNAVALCPNCHRRCHYSHDSDEFKLRLYEKIPRLKLEVPEPIDAGTYESISVDQS